MAKRKDQDKGYMAVRLTGEERERIAAAAAKVSEQIGIRIPHTTWAKAAVLRAADEVLKGAAKKGKS